MPVLLDLVLAIVVIEAFIVIGRRYTRGQKHELRFDLANLASGFFLILAVRSALANAPDVHIAGLVSLAGAFHAVDALRRFR
jgi:hypothetical protein